MIHQYFNFNFSFSIYMACVAICCLSLLFFGFHWHQMFNAFFSTDSVFFPFSFDSVI